jgi:hypothetical protein
VLLLTKDLNLFNKTLDQDTRVVAGKRSTDTADQKESLGVVSILLNFVNLVIFLIERQGLIHSQSIHSLACLPGRKEVVWTIAEVQRVAFCLDNPRYLKCTQIFAPHQRLI